MARTVRSTVSVPTLQHYLLDTSSSISAQFMKPLLLNMSISHLQKSLKDLDGHLSKIQCQIFLGLLKCLYTLIFRDMNTK